MSRSGPTSPVSDHEQHDALLVAQFVAGDPLDDMQRQQAQLLVSGCADCASLAEDLASVSRAAAWEPVPRRRRDFRLSPEQGEELRGNALTRFMRRLTLPRSRAFGPVAAGVMSIGLVFVIAGTAWPDAELQSFNVEPVSLPAPEIGEPEAPVAGFEGVEDPAADDEVRSSDTIERADRLSGTDANTEQSELAGDAAAPDAGAAEPNARKAADAAGSSLRAEEAEGASLGGVSELPNTGAEAAESESLSDVQSGSVLELAPDSVLDESVSKSVDVTTSAGTDDDFTELDQAASLGTDDGIDIETLLVALGSALAVGGAVLLLLAWLARRSADPLLP